MQSSAREPFNVQNNVVFGLNIQSPRLASLTRRVLVLAVIAAVIVIVRAALQLATLPANQALVGIIGAIFGLLVPACGYFGAKWNNENLTCCFCACNFLGGCCMLLGICSSFGFYEVAGYIVDHCDPSQADPNKCNFDWEQAFCSRQKQWTPQQCFNYLEDLYRPMQHSLIISTAVAIPLILLQCLSFCWGKQLYDTIKAGDVIHVPPSAILTRPVMAQPAGQ